MNDISLDEAAKALAELASFDRKALAQRWVKVFGYPAPHRAQVQLLRSALAWHYQMDLETKGEADQLIRRLRRQLSSTAPTAVLTPGTRLLREWNGDTHHVTVTPEGFEYAGKTYRSLTAISREITGTAWSGPKFFGLRS